MSLIIVILAWLMVGTGTASAALTAMRLARARRPARGAHAKAGPATPAARASDWRTIRSNSMIAALGLTIMASGPNVSPARWPAAAAVVFIVGLELDSWVRAGGRPKDKPEWRRSQTVLAGAITAGPMLVRTSLQDTIRWPEIILLVAITAPDIRSWLRNRTRRGPGVPAPDED